MGPLNSCPSLGCPVYLAPVEAPAPPAVGDLVSAVNGETSIIGRVAERRRPPRPRRLYHDAPTGPTVELVVGITSPTGGPSLAHLEGRGFNVTVLERYVPPLPTAPGLYADRVGDPWRIASEGKPLAFLSTGGEGGGDPAAWAPFTPLVKAGE
jgi:hypothetical protein